LSELEAANRSLRGLTDKVASLEELRATQERLLRDFESRYSLLEKELEAKASLLTTIEAETNSKLSQAENALRREKALSDSNIDLE